MLEAWLKCKIDNGMFPGELGISFEGAQGEVVSLFCTERFIDKVQSALLVTVLDKGERLSTVRLPDQSFNGTTVADVPSTSLKEVMRVP
jgi:hypothetical protein